MNDGSFKLSFFKHNPVACFVLDLTSLKFVDANAAAVTTFGYPSQLLRSMTVLELLDESGKSIFCDAVKRLGGGDVADVKTTCVGKDGQLVFVRWYITKGVGQASSHLHCVAADGSGESEVRFQDHLSSTYHDLRGPLTSARGLLNVLQARNTDNALTPFLVLMDVKLLGMDNRISKALDAGNRKVSDVSAELIDLESTVQEILARITYLDKFQKIKINVKTIGRAPFASKRTLLCTALENLITNAVNYHDINQPHPAIDITCMCRADACAIEVVDNGVGMESEFLENIFSPYYRIDAVPSSGNGLGLHLVKQALDQLGGHVSVMSRKDVGSNFLIRVPNLYRNVAQEQKHVLRESAVQ